MRWRVGIAESHHGPMTSIIASGSSVVHEAMATAEKHRVKTNGKIGLAVDLEYTLYGHRWDRYAYFMTDLQRQELEESLAKQTLDAATAYHAKTIKAKRR